MKPPLWREHPDDTATIANNVALLDSKIAGAKGDREPFTLEMPQAWHKEIHRDCKHVPSPAYIGNYRGTDHPHLANYSVKFGTYLGTPPNEVQAALDIFMDSLNINLSRLDSTMPTPPDATPSRLNPAVECTAKHYARWLRIHPFADGNGRTARVLANWILARYWQPLVLPGRPPVDREGLIAATSPAVDIKVDDFRPLMRYLRKRLTDARRAAMT